MGATIAVLIGFGFGATIWHAPEWLVLSVILVGVLLRIQYKSAYNLFRSYELEILDDTIERRQAGLPTVTIRWDEIRSVQFHLDGTTCVTHIDGERAVGVPTVVESHAELLESIENQAPVSVPPPPARIHPALLNLLIFLPVPVVWALWNIDHPELALGLGIALTAMLVWSGYKVWTNLLLPMPIRRGSLLLTFVVWMVIHRTWSLWSR